MSAPPDPLPLAAEFPPATRDQWIELVTGVLRRSGLPEDADPVAALSSTTYDGISVRPLYTAADVPPVPAGTPGSAPYLRGATADGPTLTGWDVRQRHADPDPARLRASLLNDLETGATSVWLVLGEAGLPVADLPAALDGRLRRPRPGRAGRGRADGRGRGGVPAAGRRARPRPGRGPRQPRRRPDRAARPHRGRRRPRPADPAPGPPAAAGGDRRRDRLPRRRCERRDRARGRHRGRGGLPAGADRRRPRRRRGAGRGGVPVRGQRGPVRLDRQAAGRPPRLGPGRRALRGGSRPAGSGSTRSPRPR